MKIPPLQIGDLKVKVPIIQGGMGIGVSLSKLASAVANEGGVGIISGVQIGFREPDFQTNSKEANIRALKKEINMAKKLSPNGVLGVNLMVAMNNYEELVKTVVNEEIPLIISGAGLPTILPKLTKNSKTKIAPIVSSGKAANVICKLWDRRYSYVPDLVIVEGPKAGGHLGFSLKDIDKGDELQLKDIVKEVMNTIKPFEEKYKKSIPIIAAGGIFTGKDIGEFLKLGASGVQMATRFIATEECDADIRFKKAYLSCSKEDIQIIKSPVGLPGRAIKNDFINKIKNTQIKVDKCFDCLKKCNPNTTPYCISKALIESVKGNIKEGVLFTGSNGYRLDKIVSVKDLIGELVREVKEYE